MIKEGSKWWGNDGRKFVVLANLEMDGKRWVHYRLETPEQHMPNEFSCFEESFLSRFTQLPE